MEAVLFISRLEPLAGAIAGQMDLYIPKRVGSHYVFERYDPAAGKPVEFNPIRACTPAKEFLFPLRELAAVLPEPLEPQQVQPFAVLGLKACDLRSIEILDKVFTEKEFEDPFYIARRQKMFIISSDCGDPGDSCFCQILQGKGYPERGYDLNVSKVNDGFIVEAGSAKGRDFLRTHAELFADAPDALLAERTGLRAQTEQQLEQNNRPFQLDLPVRQIMEQGRDDGLFDEQAKTCVECQACTRVCPTCHCFYLYDGRRASYFGKMKMWDSCMRMAYAEVAGGANPRKVLGDRIRHRLMHKFAYFLERYGIDMCVGCGRCVDAEAGGVDIRRILKRLNDDLVEKGKTGSKAAK